MKSAILVLLSVISFCVVQEAHAGTYFFDDYGRERPTFPADGKLVSWGTSGVGKKELVEGDLVLTVLSGSTLAGAFAPVDPYEDVSIRTRFRMEDGVGRAGIAARSTGPSVDFYWGTVTPTGQLRLERVIGIQPELLSETTVLGIDATTSDVNMKLDVFGNSISLTTWSEGSPRPTTPQLSVEDSVISSGRNVEVWMQGGTATSTRYRFFEAADRPWDPLAIVVPSEFANQEAPDVADGLPPDYRLQQLYLADEFQSVPSQQLITGARWRPDGNLDVPQTVTADQWIARMTTTSKGLDNLAQRFSENLGSDDTVVFDGPVSWEIADGDPVGGPRDFEFDLPFQTAFPYDPQQGNLLLDLTVLGASERIGLDFSVAPTATTSLIWTGFAGIITDEGDGTPLGGHVVEFTFESADCNGDGLTNLQDANCATAATIDGTLALAGLLPGDVDGNRTVEFADFVVFSANFGTAGEYTDGDLDKTGDIGFADFLILSSNFGQSSAALANVPEPTAGVLLTLGMLCLTSRFRHASRVSLRSTNPRRLEGSESNRNAWQSQ